MRSKQRLRFGRPVTNRLRRLQGSSSPAFLDCLSFEIGPIVCRNYKSMLRNIPEERRCHAATQPLQSCKMNHIFRWRTIVMYGTRANVSAVRLSAKQDKFTSFMKQLTLYYKDRTGVSSTSIKMQERGHRTIRTALQSQVLLRSVGAWRNEERERERDWSAVRLPVTARCCQSWHHTPTEYQVSERN